MKSTGTDQISKMQKVLMGIKSKFKELGVDFSRADASMLEASRLLLDERCEEAIMAASDALKTANEAVLKYTEKRLEGSESEIKPACYQQLLITLHNEEKKLGTFKSTEIGPACKKILERIQAEKEKLAAEQKAEAARIKKIIEMLANIRGTINTLDGTAARHFSALLDDVNGLIMDGIPNGTIESLESLISSFQDFVAKFHVAMR